PGSRMWCLDQCHSAALQALICIKRPQRSDRQPWSRTGEMSGSQVRTSRPGERPGIAHPDAPRIDALDNPEALQLFQLAADGFQPQAQIVSHVRACKWHAQLTAGIPRTIGTGWGCAPQDGEQQCCHSLSCSLAAEQKHPIARPIDGIERALEKNLLEIC